MEATTFDIEGQSSEQHVQSATTNDGRGRNNGGLASFLTQMRQDLESGRPMQQSRTKNREPTWVLVAVTLAWVGLLHFVYFLVIPAVWKNYRDPEGVHQIMWYCGIASVVTWGLAVVVAVTPGVFHNIPKS